MPSIITASTASNTSLTFSADTSGVLEIRTGSSPTTALTISTAQVATFANDASISGLTVGKGGGAVALSTAVGFEAAANNISNGVTALGYRAAKACTTADGIVALGVNALPVNTTGGFNVSVGRASMFTNTTGASNSVLGDAALYSNTTGGLNVAIGRDCLFNNTTASNNTAVGYQAGYSNTTGASNVSLGLQAGYAITTGANNLAVGTQSLGTSTTANGNTAIGFQALYNSNRTADANAYNTAVGFASGSAITTGAKNTIIGSYSGNQGGLDIRTASNYIVLSDGDGNPRGVFNGSGYLKAMPNQADILNLGGAYHELVSNDASNNTLFVAQKSTSTTTNGMVRLDAYRNTTDNTFYVLSYFNHGASAYKFRIADSGNATNTNGSYGTISDIKNKENIVDATPKLEKIKELKVRNFNLKGDDLKQIGFVAQEFEQVFPSMIEEHKDTDADGNDLGTTTKSIKTSVLVPILVKAIQELNAKVEALEAQLNNGA